ncbi:hypothetical protein BASA61_005339 [Batrachochytrium salamandrivorans]|nr:hypothetical protein BASA61_005339 [Batrachochytrium salamandrivorans]
MTSPNPETTSSTENGVAATTEVEAYGDATVSSGYSATSHIHDMAKTQSTVADGMTSASIPVAKEDSINPKKRPLSPELDSISSAAPTTVMSNAVVSTNRESDASKTGPRLASLATPSTSAAVPCEPVQNDTSAQCPPQEHTTDAGIAVNAFYGAPSNSHLPTTTAITARTDVKRARLDHSAPSWVSNPIPTQANPNDASQDLPMATSETRSGLSVRNDAQRESTLADPRLDRPLVPPQTSSHPAGTEKKSSTAKPTDSEIISNITIKMDGGGAATATRTLADSTLDKMQFNEGQRAIVNRLIEEAKKNKKMGDVVVVNDARLISIPDPAGADFLGHVIYTGARSRNPHSNRAADLQLYLLPQFTIKHYYATIEVRIPSEYLTYRGNIAVRKSAVWGTDIYTDDSDIVAMIIHSGHYRPVDAPDPTPEERAHSSHRGDGYAGRNLGSKERSSSTVHRTSVVTQDLDVLSPISSHVLPLIAIPDLQTSSTSVLYPDHDLHVTLRILPKLLKYTGSTRYGLDSRGWGGSHDGESMAVEKVERVERGSVGRKGRKVFSKRWGELAKAVTKEEAAVIFDGGLIERHIDTEFDDDFGDLTVVFSEYGGEACIKYTPKIMLDWPSHMLNMLTEIKPPVRQLSSTTAMLPQSSVETPVSDTTATEMATPNSLKFSRQELKEMESWPYWRVKLRKFICFLETVDGVRHELRKDDVSGLTYRLEKVRRPARIALRRRKSDEPLTTLSSTVKAEHRDLHGSISASAPSSATTSTIEAVTPSVADKMMSEVALVASGILPNALSWTEAGLCVHAHGSKPLLVLPVHRVYWRKSE